MDGTNPTVVRMSGQDVVNDVAPLVLNIQEAISLLPARDTTGQVPTELVPKQVQASVYWVPIFGVSFSTLLLGEPLTVWHLLGLGMVLGGTWLGTR